MAERYFHGGRAGIWPGRILPPDVTKAPSTADYGARGVCRTDRVYVTTSPDAAAMFAAMAPGERVAVYEVAPDGPVEPDEDCDQPGLSFACRAARIIRETPMSKSHRTMIQRVMMAGDDRSKADG